MRLYGDFAPTGFDTRGFALPDRQEWLVVLSRNRDSGCVDESNFATALSMLGGESETVEIHRFGHWACGWFEIIIVEPASDAARIADEIESSLAGYPVLDSDDLSRREHEAAAQTWADCYCDKDRIAYIRKHRSDFEFHSFADMLACVRGKFFAGDTTALLY